MSSEEYCAMQSESIQQKILIIEDEAVFRMTLSAFLRQNHFLVMDAQNGAEGLALVAMFQPDIVLCDLHMPVLDGHQVINIIRKRYPDIPVIVISGVDNFDEIRQVLREGACDYLLKPISQWQVVKEAIHDCLLHKHCESQNLKELEEHRQALQHDDFSASRLLQMVKKDSPFTVPGWKIDFQASTPFLYADFYAVEQGLMVVIIELYAEMLDAAFIAAMIKFLLDPPYRQFQNHENQVFESPRNVLNYLNWHLNQSGILCNINCSVLMLQKNSDVLHYANAGISSPYWLKQASNLSLGLLPEMEYRNFNKSVQYPFEMTVQTDLVGELKLVVSPIAA